MPWVVLQSLRVQLEDDNSGTRGVVAGREAVAKGEEDANLPYFGRHEERRLLPRSRGNSGGATGEQHQQWSAGREVGWVCMVGGRLRHNKEGRLLAEDWEAACGLKAGWLQRC